jgi:hypothetical protein
MASSGCGKFKHEATYSMDPGDIKLVNVDAPRGEQKVTVEISSPGAPVDVWLVLEDHYDAVSKKVNAGVHPDAATVVASKVQLASGTLQGIIPAGKAYKVVITGARKKTDVTVKVTGE